eukprot:1156958-Pelagomonas_calceolata.AAC.4
MQSLILITTRAQAISLPRSPSGPVLCLGRVHVGSWARTRMKICWWRLQLRHCRQPCCLQVGNKYRQGLWGLYLASAIGPIALVPTCRQAGKHCEHTVQAGLVGAVPGICLRSTQALLLIAACRCSAGEHTVQAGLVGTVPGALLSGVREAARANKLLLQLRIGGEIVDTEVSMCGLKEVSMCGLKGKPLFLVSCCPVFERQGAHISCSCALEERLWTLR